VIDILENNRTFLNQNPKCEPQLGRRGLYRNLAGQAAVKLNELALLWVLNLSDGSHSLLDISERSEMEFSVIKWASNALTECGLLRELSSQ
jgi:aminopeptidase-like protein